MGNISSDIKQEILEKVKLGKTVKEVGLAVAGVLISGFSSKICDYSENGSNKVI